MTQFVFSSELKIEAFQDLLSFIFAAGHRKENGKKNFWEKKSSKISIFSKMNVHSLTLNSEAMAL